MDFPRYSAFLLQTSIIAFSVLENQTLSDVLWCALQMCPSDRGSTERLCNPSSLVALSEHSHFRTIQRQAAFDMELSKPLTAVTVLRPEPWILEPQPCHSENRHGVSHSTPNTEAYFPTHQTFSLTLPNMEPAEGSVQQNTSELEAQSGLNDYIANTVSTCGTDCYARTANQDNTDNTKRPANADRVVSAIYDVNTKNAISVCSEYHASTVGVSCTAESVSMVQSETLATSVDKITTETDQLTIAEKGASVERDSSIEAVMEGFTEEEGKVAQEGKVTVTPQSSQEAKIVGVMEEVESVTRLEEQPSFSQSSSKAAESQGKKKGRL